MTPANKTSTLVSALLCLILCVRFSASYFSYALSIFLLFLLWDLWIYRKNKALRLPALNGQLFITGIALCYGSCLLSSALLGDVKSLKETVDITSLSLPFFMLYFLRSNHPVDFGIRWGFFLGALIFCIGAFFVHPDYAGPRMISFFAHPNHLGTAIAILFPFAAWHFCRTKHLLVRLIIAVLDTVMLYCLWRTESRGAMVALAAGIGLSFFVMAIVQRKAISMKRLAVLALSACLVLATGTGLLYEIQSARSARSARGGERIEMLKASYEMWQDHKLLGVGLANWQENYYSERYHPKNGIEEGLSMPHNMPAYFFSTAGLLGGTGYLAFLLLSFAALYRAAARTRDKWLAVAALAAFFAFHIHGLVDSTIINKIPARIFFALMGYALATMLSEDDTEKRIPQ